MLEGLAKEMFIQRDFKRTEEDDFKINVQPKEKEKEMSFANWKERSKLYRTFRDRAINYGIGYDEVCAAAYKAGERQGHKDAEWALIAALELREMEAEERRAEHEAEMRADAFGV